MTILALTSDEGLVRILEKVHIPFSFSLKGVNHSPSIKKSPNPEAVGVRSHSTFHASIVFELSYT
jgi:hypothetical protein